MNNLEQSPYYEKNFQALCAYFRSGIKEAHNMKLGIEIEHFVLEHSGHAPRVINYESGVKELLETMLDLLKEDACPLIIDQQLMGLQATSTQTARAARQTALGDLAATQYKFFTPLLQTHEFVHSLLEQADELLDEAAEELTFTLTLEPASQLEISLGPCCSASQAMIGLLDFYTLFILAAQRLKRDLTLLCQGYNPLNNARELPLINKQRYQLMDKHFQHTGIHGIDMMRGSASTQISLDYSSEEECIQRYRLACALGPLFAFIFDNAEAQHCTELSHAKRMVRSHIWRGVDSARCGLPPTLFDEGFNFEAYAHWLETIPAILGLHEDHSTYDAQNLSIGDLLNSDHLLSKGELEHLLSMAFPNTRLKNFIEIRDVDSLDPLLAGAYISWIRGIFYDAQAAEEVASLLGLERLSVAELTKVRTALMQEGWEAQVYGMPMHNLALKLHELALAGLERQLKITHTPDSLKAHELQLLSHFRTYLEAYVCPKDLPFGIKKLKGKHYAARWRYEACKLNNLTELRTELQQGLAQSRAQKHGKLINWPFTPKIFTRNEDQYFKQIAETAHRIMEKATQYFLDHPEFRKKFKLSNELMELCLLDRGYTSLIPLARIDIFYDEEHEDFKFCELNTDGSSGQIFMHETERLLRQTELYRKLDATAHLHWHDTMSYWAKSLLDIYEDYCRHTAQNKLCEPCNTVSKVSPQKPHIALIDWAESIMMTECDYFIELFEQEHDCEARFVDIRDLIYLDGKLYDKQDLSWHIDLVWRRAVTSEMFEKMDEGARALITACKEHAICSVGSFITHISGIKEFLPLLCSDEAAAFLSPEELAFMRKHSPQTFELNHELDLEEFAVQPERWIIKAHDGYGGKGVYAGIDYTQTPERWKDLLQAKLEEQGYIIQEYIRPYKSYELDNARQAAPEELFELYDNLLGLYVFDGIYGGILQRIGKNSTITSDTGGYYQACFIVEGADEHQS